MDRTLLIYSAYMLFFLALTGSIILVPVLAFSHDMQWAYDAFAPLCHQKVSRSLCVFSDGSSSWVGDCTPQNGTFVKSLEDWKATTVTDGGVKGFKMPLCARDFGIYAAMLLGGLAYPLFRKPGERSVYPAIYLILALVPIGIDGSVQLISDMGILQFSYESTNLMRLVTGGIAGGAAAFYAIPLLVNFFGTEEEPAPKKTGRAKQD